ncbi:polysaccharide deacetylase family protein [Paenibacillus qinlingensis]|uniref:Peptidoglycan/xylan/chitin deacetylase (PgdA/CDA1 family) n=1 Tax=Paenibacillus qinlingensis TaxID=1837343 RepID=A0ABU1NPV6_9BACL|nr:polysaccharide deacetylase family protein [Paenibacillus qinlingensis]MDR6549485.1 peptidoglycan/xylan/chitin deacetylase (PgdA/CDA1 family) [Paenibacillus qinlingensis]
MKYRMLVVSLLAVIIVILNFSPVLVSAKDVYYSNEVAVLVYHHIDENEQSSVTITPKLFQRQLVSLQRKGFQFITLDEFKDFKSKGKAVPDNALLVTFDDGYESFYTYAYPILQKLHIPAVNFVITKDLEDPKRPKLASLSKDEIRLMRSENSYIDFQGHSDELHAMRDGKPMLSNKILNKGTLETDDEFKIRVVQDTRNCMAKLKALQASKEVDAYAYPYGSYDGTTISYLQEAGVRYAFTTKSGIASDWTDPMQIPRINGGSPFVRPHSISNLIKQAKREQSQFASKN